MTVVLTLPVSGRPKRDLIEMANEVCGQAGFEFELTPEEVASNLRTLDMMMAEHPFNLMGYDPATYGSGDPEAPSGLVNIDVPAVYSQLALRIAAGKGKTLAPTAAGQIAMTYSSACSRYASMPVQPLAPNTVRGSGSRWGSPWFGPFINEDAVT